MPISQMSTHDEARKALGQLIITGFSGLDLSNDTAAFLSQANIGGVILFAPNYESPAQVAELINQVQECRTEQPFWVAVDQEGGRVQRFKKGFSWIPDAATVGSVESSKLVFELAEMMAKELAAVGVNLNFCPVADIRTNPKDPVIGNRAYGATEDKVSRLVTAVVRGHLVAGVQPCVKHFPGHGDAAVDSHFALPKLETPLEALRDRELKPFVKAFKSRCSMVMTGHIVYSTLDPEFPATLSKKVLRELLRKEMRYSRLIVSDDMEMKAITDHYGAEDAPRLAIEAGCDLLIYRSEAAARHAYTALLQALDDGKLAPEIVIEAEARIKALKKDVLNPYKAAVIPEVAQKVGTPENEAIVKRILESANKT